MITLVVIYDVHVVMCECVSRPPKKLNMLVLPMYCILDVKV